MKQIMIVHTCWNMGKLSMMQQCLLQYIVIFECCSTTLFMLLYACCQLSTSLCCNNELPLSTHFFLTLSLPFPLSPSLPPSILSIHLFILQIQPIVFIIISDYSLIVCSVVKRIFIFIIMGRQQFEVNNNRQQGITILLQGRLK